MILLQDLILYQVKIKVGANGNKTFCISVINNGLSCKVALSPDE